MGQSSGDDLKAIVHADLKQSGTQASEAIAAFGATVESLLIKHKKDIVREWRDFTSPSPRRIHCRHQCVDHVTDQQFALNRLADAAIDTYAMVVVLSRCSRSLDKNFATAETEKELVQLFCNEASDRVRSNLRLCTSSTFASNSEKMRHISQATVSAGGVFHDHPLGF